MNIAWCQKWEESERGWGVRPDGYSLHLTRNDVKVFISQSMLDQQQYFEGLGIKGVPDEYSRPSGEPYLVQVDDEQFKEIDYDGHVNGKRYYNNRYPQEIK